MIGNVSFTITSWCKFYWCMDYLCHDTYWTERNSEGFEEVPIFSNVVVISTITHKLQIRFELNLVISYKMPTCKFCEISGLKYHQKKLEKKISSTMLNFKKKPSNSNEIPHNPPRQNFTIYNRISNLSALFEARIDNVQSAQNLLISRHVSISHFNSPITREN